jgi:uncharacterized DUF497 family protein
MIGRPTRGAKRWYNSYIRVRSDFDLRKSRSTKKKHGVGLDEAQEIFDQVYIVDKSCDHPEQFRAIGWCRGRLCSTIFEIRRDADGEYHHLVTTWKATEAEERLYAENV